MAVIGYARVSTAEQNLDLRLTALKSAGAARTFADNGVSGSTVEGPAKWTTLPQPGPRNSKARISASDIGKMPGVSRATIYRYLTTASRMNI